MQETFLDLRIISEMLSSICLGLQEKHPLFFILYWDLNFVVDIWTSISINIRPAGEKLFYADGPRDVRRDIMKLVAALKNFANLPEINIFDIETHLYLWSTKILFGVPSILLHTHRAGEVVHDVYELLKTLSLCCIIVDKVRVEPRTEKPLHHQRFDAETGEFCYSKDRNYLLWNDEENGARSLIFQCFEMKIVLVLCKITERFSNQIEKNKYYPLSKTI